MKNLKLFLYGFLACSLFWSCDLLESVPEEDIKQQIEDAVKEANAPVINVRVADVESGSTTPGGTLPNA
jgi:hypothetical protein